MKLTLATASFLVLCTAASAQNAVPTGETHRTDPACIAAVQNVCPGVKPGEGRIKDCLKAHNTSFKQLCPQDAKPHRHIGQQLSHHTAPVAQPPAGQ